MVTVKTVLTVRDLIHDICMAKRPLNYDIGWPFSGFGQPLLYSVHCTFLLWFELHVIMV